MKDLVCCTLRPLENVTALKILLAVLFASGEIIVKSRRSPHKPYCAQGEGVFVWQLHSILCTMQHCQYYHKWLLAKWRRTQINIVSVDAKRSTDSTFVLRMSRSRSQKWPHKDKAVSGYNWILILKFINRCPEYFLIKIALTIIMWRLFLTWP